MSRDAEDDDHATFLRRGLPNGEGDEPALSQAAYHIYCSAILGSVGDGSPGFVSDELLNSIQAETTITAAELSASKMWRRVDGGYQVLNHMTVNALEKLARLMDNDRAFCEATGGHEWLDDEPDVCGKCLAERPTGGD
ncbi:MAG: hypothetical protein LBV34_25875 [Nocardiopsaceae bacterium]|jgi:hypothetical protein|nr:hypothetical protein [Nocardiopsaceae bacterium]